MHHSSWRTGACGEHPRTFDHRAIPRAFADILLPQRSGRPGGWGVLHWVSGLDVSESDRAGRSSNADRPAFTAKAALEPVANDVKRPAASLGHGRERRLPPVNPGSG